MQYDCMSIQITIRNVPEELRDKLAARAALQRQSMQEYLLCELERMASRPTVSDWLDSVREHKASYGIEIPLEDLLEARDCDRK